MAPSFTPSPSQKRASHPRLIPLTDEPSLPLTYSSDLLIFLILLPPPYAGPSSPRCVEYFVGQLTNLLAFSSPLDYPLSSSQRCVKHEYDHIIPFWEIVGSPLPTGQSTSSRAWPIFPCPEGPFSLIASHSLLCTFPSATPNYWC